MKRTSFLCMIAGLMMAACQAQNAQAGSPFRGFSSGMKGPQFPGAGGPAMRRPPFMTPGTSGRNGAGNFSVSGSMGPRHVDINGRLREASGHLRGQAHGTGGSGSIGTPQGNLNGSGRFDPKRFDANIQQGRHGGSAQGIFNGKNSSLTGGFNNQSGVTQGHLNRTGAGFVFNGADGSSRGGNITGNTRKFNGGTHHIDPTGMGYKTNIQKDGGRLRLNGNMQTPTTYPGIQHKFQNRNDINGRNSKFNAGMTANDPSGRGRHGEMSASLDRKQLDAKKAVGVGGLQAKTETNAKFNGKNSSVGTSGSVKAGGVASGNGSANVNRKGASGSASVKVGGAKIEAKASISPKGSSIKVGGAKFSL